MLLVAARLPSSTGDGSGTGTGIGGDDLAAVARVSGLAPADVRARLAGTLPRVLLTEGDPDRAQAIATELEALGFVILLCDPRAAPGDDDRLVARSLEFGAGSLTVVDAGGEREEVTATSLCLVQKGARITTQTHVTKKSERRLDLTRAVLTGGLLLTKKVETESKRTTTARDAFVLLHRTDGGRDVMLYERRIDYRFLGADLQPSSAANFDRLIARLRAFAPRTPFDDRVSRPGFVSAPPSSPARAVDLALWLVLLTHLRGVGRL